MTSFLADTLLRDPYPLYRLLRSARPVLRLPRLGHFMLFDFESVKRALDDPDSFGSDPSAAGIGNLDWFILLDPPRHTRLRRLVSHAFTPRGIGNLEPRIGALAHALLDAIAARGSADLVEDFTVPLPLMVIAELLGVSATDWPLFRRWSDGILGLIGTIQGGPRAVAAASVFRGVRDEIRAYLAPLIERRRKAPTGDLLSRLVHAEVEGEHLDDGEIGGFFELLLFAGHETTANLIGNAVLCLLEHPRQLELLRAEPGRWPAAIEEVLRHRSPLQAVFRVTRREVELRGRTLPAGKLVLVMVGSANRDGRQFPDPARFDITRAPNPHLAFGRGIHACVGAPLARLEARIALPALFERLPALALQPSARWTPRASFQVHGPARLLVSCPAKPG